MFSVLFEVQPQRQQWDAYCADANMRRPELAQLPGFVHAVLYRSLARNGWLLSVSGWRDSASVAGWPERIGNDEADERDPDRILDYRLRVGEVTSDTRVAVGSNVEQHRTDRTGSGEGAHVTLIDAKQAPEWVRANNPQEIALYLGFDLYSYGDCISWDILEAVAGPGDIMLVVTWKDSESANAHAATQIVPEDARVRVVRIVRDQAMPVRRETPQEHPDRADRQTVRA